MDENFYRSIIKEQPIGYAFLKIIRDEQGMPLDYELLDINTVFEALHGLQGAAIVGKRLSQILPENSDNRIQIMKLNEEIAINGGRKDIELYFLTFQRWYRITAFSKKHEFIVTYFCDISNEMFHFAELENRMQTEYKFKNQTGLFNQLLNSIPDLIFYKSIDGLYLGCNNEFTRFVDKGKEEIIGKSDEELFGIEIAEKYTTQDRLIIESGRTVEKEEWDVYPDGQKILLDTLKAPLYDDNGIIVGVLGISRDLTDRKQIEEKLKSSEENFRTFFETIDDMIFIATQQGEIFYANHTVTVKLGYFMEELKKMHLPDICTADKRDECYAICHDMPAGMHSFCSFPLVKKDGSLLPANTRVWQGKWNNTACIFCISKDLSKEEETMQKFNKVFENNPTLMVISSLSDHLFTEVNTAFLNKTGYTREEIIGKTAAELNLFTQQELQHEIVEELQKKGNTYNTEQEIRTKSGSILKGLFSGEIIESQGTKYFLTVITDVTEQKLAEGSLIKQAEIQKLLTSISTKCINLPLDEVHNVIKLSLKDISEFIEADRAYIVYIENEVAEIQYDYCTEGLTYHIDTIKTIMMEVYHALYNLREGDLLAVSDIATIPKNLSLKEKMIKIGMKSFIILPFLSEMEFFGYLVFETINEYHTFTENEIMILTLYSQMLVNVRNRLVQEKAMTAAKEQAEAANVAKSRFLANMSHEIRTPMNGIVGFLQLLEMSAIDKEQLEYINDIKISTETLLSLINDILDVSKIEAGKIELENIPFELRSTVEAAVIPYTAKARMKNLNLNVLIRSDVPQYVIGDATRLRQVITNLISNAVKFTDKGNVSVVVERLELRNDEEEINFSVQDTGIGMSNEVIGRIFEPFTQADNSSTRKYGGTGLGLSICKSIIELMGSTIDIQSEEGIGTKVSFTIRLKESDVIPDKAKTDYSLLRGKKIMIVDDNTMNRDITKSFLFEAECSVIEADSAADAISKLITMGSNNCDMILIDYNMLYVNGYDMAATLKTIPNTKDIPLILLTSTVTRGDFKNAMKHGFSGYIAKPYKRSDLLDCILSKYTDSLNKNISLKIDEITEYHESYNISQTKTIQKVITRARVLVVDDEPMNLKLLESTLKEDYDIIMVTNGKEALKIATSEFHPDIILLDIMMPEMDGFEVCKKLREMSETKEIPVVFLTALKDEKSEEYALQLGVVDYITKPFSIPIVKGRVKNHIELKKYRDEQRENSLIDELTQIANRRKFNSVLAQEWDRAKRTGNVLSVIIIDIDQFKKYNDFYGHLQGDQCLYTIAQALLTVVKRPADLVARWGGEEFVCILPETDLRGAASIGEHIRKAVFDLAIPNEMSTIEQVTTVCVGVAAMIPTNSNSYEDLLKIADKALYTAKKTGRNRMVSE